MRPCIAMPYHAGQHQTTCNWLALKHTHLKTNGKMLAAKRLVFLRGVFQVRPTSTYLCDYSYLHYMARGIWYDRCMLRYHSMVWRGLARICIVSWHDKVWYVMALYIFLFLWPWLSQHSDRRVRSSRVGRLLTC